MDTSLGSFLGTSSLLPAGWSLPLLKARSFLVERCRWRETPFKSGPFLGSVLPCLSLRYQSGCSLPLLNRLVVPC
jgi:hypothetical protein